MRRSDYLFRMLTGQGDKAKGGAKEYVANGKMVDGFAFVDYAVGCDSLASTG
jgi:hypothetical protein